MAWWPELQFASGTLEFDVRGKDMFQKSFVGVAFHGLGEKTYDVVCFRPFNFRATGPARRNHAVQYVALPAPSWLTHRASGLSERNLRPSAVFFILERTL